MKVRKQQVPETAHILSTPLTTDTDKHDDGNDDGATNHYFDHCHPVVLLLPFNTNSSSV